MDAGRLWGREGTKDEPLRLWDLGRRRRRTSMVLKVLNVWLMINHTERQLLSRMEEADTFEGVVLKVTGSCFSAKMS
jgi:hypothetical protein